MIHTVKGFGIVNKAEDVFLELSLFNDPMDVGNLISGSSDFSKSILNIRKFTVHILLKPGLENLSITLLACEMSAVMWYYEHSFHTVHGVLKARILKWFATPFSNGPCFIRPGE